MYCDCILNCIDLIAFCDENDSGSWWISQLAFCILNAYNQIIFLQNCNLTKLQIDQSCQGLSKPCGLAAQNNGQSQIIIALNAGMGYPRMNMKKSPNGTCCIPGMTQPVSHSAVLCERAADLIPKSGALKNFQINKCSFTAWISRVLFYKRLRTDHYPGQWCMLSIVLMWKFMQKC